MNKSEAIRKHLKRYKSITTWGAIQMYRETRLSSVICNCRKNGWVIESNWVYPKNADKYVKYTLVELPE